MCWWYDKYLIRRGMRKNNAIQHKTSMWPFNNWKCDVNHLLNALVISIFIVQCQNIIIFIVISSFVYLRFSLSLPLIAWVRIVDKKKNGFNEHLVPDAYDIDFDMWKEFELSVLSFFLSFAFIIHWMHNVTDSLIVRDWEMMLIFLTKIEQRNFTTNNSI